MDSRPRSPLSFALADPLADKEVLALASLAWSEDERAQQWRDVRAAALADPSSVVLIAARDGETLAAAAVAQIMPGRAAVVWPPQFVANPLAPNVGEAGVLLAEMAVVLAERGAALAQALLACDVPVQAGRLAAGGFRRAANLLYMSAEAARFPSEPPPLPFDLAPYAASGAADFLALLERTYVGTLDCPQIDGLRAAADVVRGHQAVGKFRPELWQIARHEGRDVGCLLVNLHPDVRHAELVYLGVIPEVRGRGFGQALTRHALWLAAETKCDRLVLAVDAANGPAVRAYQAAGLSAWDRRAIWIRPLATTAS
jgi:ribosomal protein S18 acetylase RimI-like enzyme